MDPAARAKEVIEKVLYMTIASVDEAGLPWNAPVFMAYDRDYNFYWGTYKGSQKAQNVRGNKNIFLVIYDSTAAPGTGWGVYIRAVAEELTDPKEIEAAHKLLWDRHITPYWKLEQTHGDAPIQLYKAVPQKVWTSGEGKADGHYIDTRVEITL